MRILFPLFMATLLLVLPVSAEPFIYKSIKLDPPVEGLGGKLEIALKVLHPEVIFFGDRTIQGNPPSWAMTKLAALNLTPEDIPKRFTPEYLSNYGTPKLGRTAPEIYSSVTHGVFVKQGDAVYGFVSGSYSTDRSKLATEARGYGTSVLTADEWKITYPPQWCVLIPINNLNKIQAIIDRGAARLVDGEIQPAPPK